MIVVLHIIFTLPILWQWIEVKICDRVHCTHKNCRNDYNHVTNNWFIYYSVDKANDTNRTIIAFMIWRVPYDSCCHADQLITPAAKQHIQGEICWTIYAHGVSGALNRLSKDVCLQLDDQVKVFLSASIVKVKIKIYNHIIHSIAQYTR